MIDTSKFRVGGCDLVVSAARHLIYVHQGLRNFLSHQDQRLELRLGPGNIDLEGWEGCNLEEEIRNAPNAEGMSFTLIDVHGDVFRARLTRVKQNFKKNGHVIVLLAVEEELSDFSL